MKNWWAWNWDWMTASWVIWMIVFFVLETIALKGNGQTLTQHLRPLFINHPLTWFLLFGIWLWLGYHFLLEPWYKWMWRL